MSNYSSMKKYNSRNAKINEYEEIQEHIEVINVKDAKIYELEKTLQDNMLMKLIEYHSQCQHSSIYADCINS